MDAIAVLLVAILHSLENRVLRVPAVQRRLERECQHAARRQRIDECIHMPARSGVARVEPALVIGARLVDALLQFVRQRLAFFGSLSISGP